jgi:hypothetical protein
MPFAPKQKQSPVILRTDPRWFLTRGIGWGLLFPLLLRAIGAGSFGFYFAFGFALLWLLFRNSSITLDSEGFRYKSVLRNISHSWDEVERFGLVQQRMYGFITISHSLGWNYSPAYKHYKRLAIPRTLARWVGTTDAMVKPVGFNVPALVAVMNEYLKQARAANQA